MKVCCASDLHGHFPEIPDCDLLLLGGDYCPTHRQSQLLWFRTKFAPYIAEIAARGIKIVGVAGNHDWLYEDAPGLAPQMDWTYLETSGCKFRGFNIWGDPHQPIFHYWAFNRNEQQLVRKWQMIPDDTDILLLHGPPYKHGDFSPYGLEHTGSPGLLQRIKEIKPKLVVCGHIHSARGFHYIGDTTVINASVVDEKYRLVHEPIVIEID